MGMGFQFEQQQVEIVRFELGFGKNNLLGNGIRTPPPPPPLSFRTLV